MYAEGFNFKVTTGVLLFNNGLCLQFVRPLKYLVNLM